MHGSLRGDTRAAMAPFLAHTWVGRGWERWGDGRTMRCYEQPVGGRADGMRVVRVRMRVQVLKLTLDRCTWLGRHALCMMWAFK